MTWRACVRRFSLVLARGAYGVSALRPIGAAVSALMRPELGNRHLWLRTYSLPLHTSLLDSGPRRLANRPSVSPGTTLR